MEKFIYPLNKPCVIAPELLEWAKQQTYYTSYKAVRNDPKHHRMSPECSPKIPKEIIDKDPTLVMIHDMCDVLGCVVFKTSPFEVYKFHIDDPEPNEFNKYIPSKSAALNVLLQDTRSTLMFYERWRNKQHVVPFYEHVYEKNKYYLLNVGHYHSWINYENDRYLLSVRIRAPSYGDIVQKLKDNVSQ